MAQEDATSRPVTGAVATPVCYPLTAIYIPYWGCQDESRLIWRNGEVSGSK